MDSGVILCRASLTLHQNWNVRCNRPGYEHRRHEGHTYGETNGATVFVQVSWEDDQ